MGGGMARRDVWSDTPPCTQPRMAVAKCTNYTRSGTHVVPTSGMHPPGNQRHAHAHTHAPTWDVMTFAQWICVMGRTRKRLRVELGDGAATCRLAHAGVVCARSSRHRHWRWRWRVELRRQRWRAELRGSRRRVELQVRWPLRPKRAARSRGVYRRVRALLVGLG